MAACAVGRLSPGGSWVGFAAGNGDGYDLVVGGPSGSRRAPGQPELLIALAIAYFEDSLDAPPDELAATHEDVAALVRHVAGSTEEDSRRQLLSDAVDAIDDGLAADVVIGRLSAALPPAEVASDPISELLARARELAG